jgi:hypothetical protein
MPGYLRRCVRAPAAATRRPSLSIALALALLAGLATPAAAGTDTSDAESLAVVNAGGGSLREAGEGYRLTLTQVAPRAIWFSDRPSRDVGLYSISEFEDVFFVDDDAPNAALEVFAGRAAGDVVVVELTNPRYQARVRRLVFDARVLGRDEVLSTALDGYAARATGDPPVRFGAAALFIDDASGPCAAAFWGGQNGVISSRSNIDCTEAQAVLAQALAQHPANIGADRYEYDFSFYTETWHADDESNRASLARTDHEEDDPQSFGWSQCFERGGNEYC